jgi:hypothetical protein
MATTQFAVINCCKRLSLNSEPQCQIEEIGKLAQERREHRFVLMMTFSKKWVVIRNDFSFVVL